MVESNRNKRYCLLKDKNTSPDGKYMLYQEEVKIEKFMVKIYPELEKSDVQIYDGLNYRHGTLGTKANTIMFL
jgi:hypothetical protein